MNWDRKAGLSSWQRQERKFRRVDEGTPRLPRRRSVKHIIKSLSKRHKPTGASCNTLHRELPTKKPFCPQEAIRHVLRGDETDGQQAGVQQLAGVAATVLLELRVPPEVDVGRGVVRPGPAAPKGEGGAGRGAAHEDGGDGEPDATGQKVKACFGQEEVQPPVTHNCPPQWSIVLKLHALRRRNRFSRPSSRFIYRPTPTPRPSRISRFIRRYPSFSRPPAALQLAGSQRSFSLPRRSRSRMLSLPLVLTLSRTLCLPSCETLSASSLRLSWLRTLVFLDIQRQVFSGMSMVGLRMQYTSGWGYQSSQTAQVLGKEQTLLESDCWNLSYTTFSISVLTFFSRTVRLCWGRDLLDTLRARERARFSLRAFILNRLCRRRQPRRAARAFAGSIHIAVGITDQHTVHSTYSERLGQKQTSLRHPGHCFTPYRGTQPFSVWHSLHRKYLASPGTEFRPQQLQHRTSI